MSAQKVYAAYERMPDLRGETPYETTKNMYKEFDSLCYNIWDEGDDEPFGLYWEIGSKIPFCNELSQRVRSLINMWNEKMIKGDRLIIQSWERGYQVQMYFDHDSKMKDKFRDLTKRETLEFLRAMIPLDPYNSNGWCLSGRNEHFPEHEAIYVSRESQRSMLPGFSVEVLKHMRNGIFQPRACL